METTKWVLDPSHSEINFKVKHLMISTVTGSIDKFNVEVVSPGADFTDADIRFEADMSTINTHNEQRDGHLKSTDFFDVEKFPLMNFISSSLTKKNDGTYVMKGNLTIRGITKPIELDAEYGGAEKDADGNIRIGFEVEGRLSRQEFGLNYMQLTDSGGLVIGEDVKLIANIQLVKQQ